MKVVFAILSGLLFAFAFPNVAIGWLILVAPIPLFLALARAKSWPAAYALGALILVVPAAIAWLIVTRPRGMRLVAVVAPVTILCFLWWATGLVAEKLIGRQRIGPTYIAALLQPNISQEMRWDATSLSRIFQRMMDMTDAAIRSGASIVVWPESTVPLSYSRTDFYRDDIESVSRQANVEIILGSGAEDPENPNRIWNAGFLVRRGNAIGHY